jgi:hypothetical protein
VNDERQAFEAWALSVGWHDRDLIRAHSGDYREWPTQKAWQGWRGAHERLTPCGCSIGTCESKPNRLCRMTVEIAERAELQAARAASPVPAGWKLVPVEPTDKQLLAAHAAFERLSGQVLHQSIAPVYAAMLAASPPAPPTPQQAVAWQERQQLSVGGPWTGWYDSGQRPLDAPRSAHIGGIPVEWRPLYASPPTQQPAEATSDQIIELAGALEIRRILEAIKDVAKLCPADDMPTPFQSAWQGCCEEIFYRATGYQWHMDEDETKFHRAAQPPTPQPPQGAQQE